MPRLGFIYPLQIKGVVSVADEADLAVACTDRIAVS